eukprot:TRINITY_DN9024_c0_g1_i1.p1 TRINITY_DN9024_c0_g1~~TRINITY_DN9024_c0_g1_i1.p1  ORF type:complete len:150 (-),score=26.61 TRINITY_DN9024_c0_g1_i1:45-494(-)
MFKRFNIPPVLLGLLALWIFILAAVAVGTGIKYGTDIDADEVTALHAVMAFWMIMMVLCGVIAVFAGLASHAMGVISVISATFLLVFSWLCAGLLIFATQYSVLDSVGKAALAFDIATGFFTFFYLLLSIRSTRFQKKVVVVETTKTAV